MPDHVCLSVDQGALNAGCRRSVVVDSQRSASDRADSPIAGWYPGVRKPRLAIGVRRLVPEAATVLVTAQDDGASGKPVFE